MTVREPVRILGKQLLNFMFSFVKRAEIEYGIVILLIVQK
jgi:hypothetical protein